MSELFDKEVNAQNSLKKTSRVQTSLHKPTKNVRWQCKKTIKNIFDGSKGFMLKTCHGYQTTYELTSYIAEYIAEAYKMIDKCIKFPPRRP